MSLLTTQSLPARRAALACALALAFAGVANAQNALGDGRLLDRNTRLGSGGVNGRTRIGSPELVFRNAIVTGNAPGGMHFRGDIDYTAPMDFRGELGSEEVFQFTRDSYFSGLATSPIGERYRGVDALQFQLQTTTQGVGVGGQRFEPTLSRGLSQTMALAQGTAPDTGSLSRMYEPLVTRPGALRSTSEYITGDALAPTLLGTAESPSGEPLYALASPLRSVAMQPDLTPRTAPTSPNRISQPVEGEEAGEGAIDGRVEGRAESTRLVHEEILESIREARQRERDLMQEQQQPADAQPGEGEDAEETLDEQLQRLREQLNNPDAEEEEVRDLARTALPAQTGARINRLVTPAQDRNLFAEHMQTGQEMLAADRWFEAEERFTSAVAMRPNDSIAAVGRIHAQIGGALYRSAAENLKSLFRASPEMITVRFDESLLPRGERLDAVRVALRDRARSDSEFARGCALLLAYLGRQYDNERDVELGLSEIDRITAALNDTPDPVYDAVRAVWAPDEDE